MYALIALGATALILCLILTPICRDIFLKFNLVDLADNDRKLHAGRIPRMGGIPIALSYMGALALMLAFAPPQAKIAVQHPGLLYGLPPGGGSGLSNWSGRRSISSETLAEVERPGG